MNGSYLKESPIRILGYSWYVLKGMAIIWPVFNFLQCLFGLFLSPFNAYNLRSLLGPIITLAEIITSGFCGIVSQSIFHVLQSDTTPYKPPSPKRRNTLLIVKLLTLIKNLIYFTKILKISTGNFPLQYN